MRRHSWFTPYNSLRFFHWAGIIVPAIIAGTSKLPKIGWAGWPDDVAEWSREWIAIVVPAGALIAIASKGLANAIGPPWIWSVIQKILDEYRTAAFDMRSDDPVHFYRVTLFKRVRWGACFRPTTYWSGGWRQWPLSGWLIPVARSGHTTQKTKTIFLVPDDANYAEGIAGQVWSRDKVVVVNDLPDVNADPSDEKTAEYARRTFVSKGWVKRRCHRKNLSLSLCGIPLEVKGDRWGVIVLDRMRTGSIKDDDAAWDHYK